MTDKKEYSEKELNKLDNLLHSNDPKKHIYWADKILSFQIGIDPPNDWIQAHFYAANNEAPHNRDLLWDMVTNMLDWADTESPWHKSIKQQFELQIELSLDFKTKDELRDTILKCKQEIIEKTENLCEEYIKVLTDHDRY